MGASVHLGVNPREERTAAKHHAHRNAPLPAHRCAPMHARDTPKASAAQQSDEDEEEEKEERESGHHGAKARLQHSAV